MKDIVPVAKLRLMRDNLKSVVFKYTGGHVGVVEDIRLALDELINRRGEDNYES